MENLPTDQALAQLAAGVVIGDYTTRPAKTWRLEPQPEVAPRDPPIRVRQTVPDCWIALELTEGKNHQVRKMTAAIGHPTLRLLRVRIGGFELGALPAGEWRELSIEQRKLVLAGLETPAKHPVARGQRFRQGLR